MKTIYNFKHILCYLLFLGLIQGVQGQVNNFNNDEFKLYHDGKELYDQAVYGMARLSFEQFLALEIIEDPNFALIRRKAEYFRALSALHLDDPEAIPLVENWMRSNPSDLMYHQAGFQLGNHFYNNKQYKLAVESFDRVNAAILSTDQEAELYFKKGYCLFVQRDFSGAKEVFIASKDVRNQYFDSVNYYYGMCCYFEGDYKEAIASFNRCLDSKAYRSYVPYYIAQIHFEQEEYGELLGFTEQYLDLEGIKKQAELHQLVGQTYFIQGEYQNALPHLAYYEANSEKMTEEEFYQLAYTQYQTGQYPDAIENFLEITREDSPIGQSSNYYLADSYLKLGDKSSARAAFQQVYQSDYNEQLKNEALFSYAKLSAELDFETEAINSFQKIPSSSPFYYEGQNILSDILIRAKNYVRAIEIIESIEPRSAEMEAAYQKASYLQATQLHRDGMMEDALPYYQKSLTAGNDLSYKAQSYFWLGSLFHENEDYTQSKAHFSPYLNLVKQIGALEFESSPAVAHYIQAYNYFKEKSYSSASDEFNKSIQLLDQSNSNNPLKVKLLSDATVRAGDCHFKQNEYNKALNRYNRAIDLDSKASAYAYFQKAAVEGLLGQPYERILSLEELINRYPKSSLTDDAMLQLGNTYLSLDNKGLAEKVFRRLANDFKGKSNLINTAYLKLGLISYNLGDAEKALSYYKEVINNNPNAIESQEAMLAIEEIYVEDIGDSEAYIEFVESMPGHNLDDFSKDSISYYIAENQYKNGNYQRAIEALNKYLDRYPEGFYTISAYYFRAESHSLLKDFTNALRDYQNVIQLGVNEKYELSLSKAALISYNHEENFALAYDLYSQLAAYAVEPSTKAEALEGALNSASRIPDDQKVIQVADKILMDSLLTDEDKAHVHFLKGKALINTEDMVEASRSLSLASTGIQNLEAAEARYLIGKILYDLQDLEEAENAVKKAIKNNKSYPYWVAKSLILLSDIYVSQNSLLKARAALEAVVENYQADEQINLEAKNKLEELEKLEQAQNRIRQPSTGDILELDEG